MKFAALYTNALHLLKKVVLQGGCIVYTQQKSLTRALLCNEAPDA